MITITNSTDHILFDWGNGKLRNILKSDIGAITIRPDKGCINIDTGDPTRYASGGFEIAFSRVESPVVSTLTDLLTLINAYARNNRIETGVRTLAIGTNTVTFDNQLPSTNYVVVYNDMDGVGMDAPSSLLTTGFTVLNVVGIGRISFSAIVI
jgi:hypothetical protein